MNYHETVVIDYLRADRALFVNTQCCIQLNQSANPDTSGPHWYCDAVAADFRNKCIFLCEISYARHLSDLIKRLESWNLNWSGVCSALVRDSFLPREWPVRPWLFVPDHLVQFLLVKLNEMKLTASLNFVPRITTLEKVQPWEPHPHGYCSWNRVGEAEKPEIVPVEMRT